MSDANMLLQVVDAGRSSDGVAYRIAINYIRVGAIRVQCAHSHAYWALRDAARRERTAHLELKGLDRAEQERLVRELTGIDFVKLPGWQRHGVGLYMETYEKVGINPLTGEEGIAVRRRIHVDPELPPRADYRERVMGLLS